MKLREKDYENILQDLKSVALGMSVTVRFERGDFKGGYCILEESRVVVINKLSTAQRKVSILAGALQELGLQAETLSGKTRMIFETLEEE